MVGAGSGQSQSGGLYCSVFCRAFGVEVCHVSGALGFRGLGFRVRFVMCKGLGVVSG